MESELFQYNNWTCFFKKHGHTNFQAVIENQTLMYDHKNENHELHGKIWKKMLFWVLTCASSKKPQVFVMSACLALNMPLRIFTWYCQNTILCQLIHAPLKRQNLPTLKRHDTPTILLIKCIMTIQCASQKFPDWLHGVQTEYNAEVLHQVPPSLFIVNYVVSIVVTECCTFVQLTLKCVCVEFVL